MPAMRKAQGRILQEAAKHQEESMEKDWLGWLEWGIIAIVRHFVILLLAALLLIPIVNVMVLRELLDSELFKEMCNR